MMIFLAILALLGLSWALAYVGVSLLSWSAAAAAGYAALLSTGWFGTIEAAVLGLPLIVLLAFNIAPVRRQFVTRHLFEYFRKRVPALSEGLRESVESGDAGWEAELFRGRPDWRSLLDAPPPALSDPERRFLDEECEQLCRAIDDWRIEFEWREIPDAIMRLLRNGRFFAMSVPVGQGGLGFSAQAQSQILCRVATRSIAVAATIAVPNALGPASLLLRYGTPEQRRTWLPDLASGRAIGCLALTGAENGTDAQAMADHGVVCYSEFNGRRTLGVRLTFDKRWISLAPIADVVGLAFRLHDPDGLLGDKSRVDYGVTCALLRTDLPGIDIGRRHYAGTAFLNGPISGRQVFVPHDWIIGGSANAGRGARMLAECAAAGRGILAPAISAAAAQIAYRTSGAYARIRRQFGAPIGRYEGVQEALARIGGYCYLIESTRRLTAAAVDQGTPSVATAIAKYHLNELMQRVVEDALDVHGGRGVQQGPRNYLSASHHALPFTGNLEGTGIVTRSLLIFGHGAVRCHPQLFDEIKALQNGDLQGFDERVWRHLGYSVNRGIRALTLALCRARLARSPVRGALAPQCRQLERMSAALAFVADLSFARFGGELQRRQRLAARLGDVLSQLYLASAVLKFYCDHGQAEEDREHAGWAIRHCLVEAEQAFDRYFTNFPNRLFALLLRRIVFPLGRSFREPDDALGSRVAEQMMQANPLRERLTGAVYVGTADDPVGRVEAAFERIDRIEPLYEKWLDAVALGELPPGDLDAQLAAAVDCGLLSADEAQSVRDYELARIEALRTDDFAATDPGFSGAGLATAAAEQVA